MGEVLSGLVVTALPTGEDPMNYIALTGLARSGKDSVAARLVERHGYVRVAFADALKVAALRTDPYIPLPAARVTVRLSALIERIGWELAKDRYPEVRRYLQEYGQTVRELDPEFWMRAAWRAAGDARNAGHPVVFTDVRYTNEADMLRRNGFDIVRVTRPGQTPGGHVSERQMLAYHASRTIVNDGSLEDLAALADLLAFPQRFALGMDA
jgi:hypothetical protein